MFDLAAHPTTPPSMPRPKRNAVEAELDVAVDDAVRDTSATVLHTLRNMWEFASLMQYIYLFGSVVKIDENFDIEDLEYECLQPQSSVLASIGLALLKYVSSHRGLTLDIFTEYTRRQYLAKSSENPFGDEEDATPFNDLDIYTRIRILQQLSTWTFTNSDRIRGLMPEDEDHLGWRMEPVGWDQDDRAYFVLDDNRLYRRTDAPLPAEEPKQKITKRGSRTSKRRKVESDEEILDEPEVKDSYGFTSKTWECVAITLDEYQDFLSTIRSRDANEKLLRRRIEEEILPVIEKRAESLRQKELKKLRELENFQKLATAKRSSRLADKADKHAKEEEERQIELKKTSELRMAREEQEKQRRIEEGHESRRLTREQRLKEREVKRILHEEELARLEREASTASEDRKRSSRNLQQQQEAHRKELERLTQDLQEDKWYFDCVVCGMHGENLDDGSHSVACERCNVWQHSGCHGFTPEQCEDEHFHFVCNSCRRKEKALKEKSGIVLKLGYQGGSNGTAKKETALPDFVRQQLDGTQRPHDPASLQSPQPASLQSNESPASAQARSQQPANLQSPQHERHLQAPQLSPSGHARHPSSVQHHQASSMQGMDQHNRMHHYAVNGSHSHAAQGHTLQPLPAYTPALNQIQHQPKQPQALAIYGNVLSSPPQATSLYSREKAPRPQEHPSLQQQSHPALQQQSHSALQQGRSSSQQGHSPSQQGRPPPQQQGYSLSPQRHAGSPALILSRGHPSSPQTLAPFGTPQQRLPPVQDTPQMLSTLGTPQQRLPPVQGTPQMLSTLGTPQILPSLGTPQMLPTLGTPQILPAPSTSQLPALSTPALGTPHTNRPAHTSFLPPTDNRMAAMSPIKSSPRAISPLNGHATASPNASFEHAPILATPSKTVEMPALPAQNASNTAVNGMKGPWPVGHQSIPHKNENPTTRAD